MAPGRRIVPSGVPALCGLIAAITLAGFLFLSDAPASTAGRPRTVGVTVTDTAKLSRTLEAIRHLDVPVTARLVLDPGGLARYRDPVRRLQRVARVMAEPVDSSGMSRIGVRGYRERFQAAMSTLGRSVGTWEVGNEVNGSWAGPRREVARKVRAAIRVVRARRGRTALTLYYNRGCRSFPSELSPLAWSRRMLPRRVRRQLDFVYLSYYETECEDRRPGNAEWQRQFRALHRLYPGARLGFGEVGLPDPATPATTDIARSIINRYYRIRPGLPYFTGGGFYWYFAQDMTPWRSSPLHRTLRAAVRPQQPGGKRTPLQSPTAR